MILKILNDKHISLRMICKEVEEPSKELAFAMSMITTMKSHNAVGLAANQVGKQIRLITINTPDFSGAMFNPTILHQSPELFPFPEGCLSIKKKVVNTEIRAKTIRVGWHDKNKTYNEKEFSDLTAVVIQHEIDHLNGRVMTDYDNKKQSI